MPHAAIRFLLAAGGGAAPSERQPGTRRPGVSCRASPHRTHACEHDPCMILHQYTYTHGSHARPDTAHATSTIAPPALRVTLVRALARSCTKVQPQPAANTSPRRPHKSGHAALSTPKHVVSQDGERGSPPSSRERRWSAMTTQRDGLLRERFFLGVEGAPREAPTPNLIMLMRKGRRRSLTMPERSSSASCVAARLAAPSPQGGATPLTLPGLPQVFTAHAPGVPGAPPAFRGSG